MKSVREPPTVAMESDPHLPEAPKVSGLRRAVFVLAGLFFVGLGALGVVLPGLPTTPFLLLACFFFVRSSPTLYRWLVRNRVFGPFLRDWQRHRAVRRPVKFTAVAVLVVVLGTSIALTRSLPVLIVLGTLGLVGLIVVLWLPVIKEGEAGKAAEEPPDLSRRDQPAGS